MCQFLFGRFENFLYKPACFAIPFLLLYKYPPSLCNLGLDTYLQVCHCYPDCRMEVQIKESPLSSLLQQQTKGTTHAKGAGKIIVSYPLINVNTKEKKVETL